MTNTLNSHLYSFLVRYQYRKHIRYNDNVLLSCNPNSFHGNTNISQRCYENNALLICGFYLLHAGEFEHCILRKSSMQITYWIPLRFLVFDIGHILSDDQSTWWCWALRRCSWCHCTLCGSLYYNDVLLSISVQYLIVIDYKQIKISVMWFNGKIISSQPPCLINWKVP